MIPVLLTKIKTRDGIWLDGIVVEPKRKSKTALIWIHGLGSNFSRDQERTKELSLLCQKNGIGYFKFNTRGHDLAARGNKKKKIIGAGFEKFEECILDIRAIILFAKKLDYKNIILAGHSTGANKALYYVYKTKDHRIKGLILCGAISDVPAGIQEYGLQKFTRGLLIGQKLLRKKSQSLMPLQFSIMTPARFLSLYKAGSKEDVFPYHNQNSNWKELKSVKVPVAVIIGSHDQYLDRPAKEFVSIFQKNATSTKSFSGIIIKGADHSFHKREKELADAIIHWIVEID